MLRKHFITCSSHTETGNCLVVYIFLSALIFCMSVNHIVSYYLQASTQFSFIILSVYTFCFNTVYFDQNHVGANIHT